MLILCLHNDHHNGLGDVIFLLWKNSLDERIGALNVMSMEVAVGLHHQWPLSESRVASALKSHS